MTGDRIDRFSRGDLTPAEARELAQASLESPELFENLTDVAIAKAALQSGTLPSERIVRFPRNAWVLIAAAIAALVVIAFLAERSPRREPKATLDLSAAQRQPALMAGGLQSIDQSRAPVFRGGDVDGRAPKATGLIYSIDDGVPTIDVGSVDGLSEGSELQVFRDDRPTSTIARLQVITVFRVRARCRILEGREVRLQDRVRVDDAAHLDALVEQIDALYNRGDADAAYKMAEQTNRWAETAHVLPLRQLAWWNQLAVLRVLRGDYPAAQAPLQQAAALSHESGLWYVRSMNNLGVLAELRGQRDQAQSDYAMAAQAFANIPHAPERERRAIEANLERIRGSH